MKNQKGSAPIFIFLAVVLLFFVAVGIWRVWSNRFQEKPTSACGRSGRVDWINEKYCNKSCQKDDDCIYSCGCGVISKSETCHDEGIIYDCVDREVSCKSNKCVLGEEKPVDEAANEKIRLLAIELCKNKKNSELDSYEGGDIYKCGDYLEVFPPNNLMDAPTVIFDSTGSIIAYCGGMPGSIPRESPKECEIKCEKTQLKFCQNN